MVGGKHHQRLLREAALFEVLREPINLVIDHAQRTEIIGNIATPLFLGVREVILLQPILPAGARSHVLQSLRSGAARGQDLRRKHIQYG